ncbi:hypothetical protein HMN09_00726400 [Mycena chlorophos]|uniref:Uncharacterized protein n=1 Tax=Mycena chlorophos TaxID=658473 RepID=A0A8H6W7F2_MYCCL|nr:hypothetical protein HMN09_00726400 [Mycena chlorophos]
MHAALGIAEIDSLICTELRLDGSLEARRGLAALVGSCRALTEPALDALWFEQDTMVNLLKIPAGLLPPDTWACSWKSDIRFSRIPSHEDALSMEKYARRIRILSADRYSSASDVQTMYCAFATLLLKLAAPPNDFCLFPNLRVLRWKFPAKNCYQFVSFFGILRSSPRVHSLALCEYGSGMKDVVLALATRMKLTTLTFTSHWLGGDYKSAAVGEEIAQLVSSLPNIRVLSLVNPAIIGLDRIGAELRHLEDLTLKMYGPPSVSSSNSNTGSRLSFVALRRLTLILGDDREQVRVDDFSPHKMDYAVDFLRHCNSLPLVSFELQAERLVTSSLNEIVAMLVERVAFPLRLRKITLALLQSMQEIFDPDAGTSLRSLFRFGNLRVLRIELSWGVDLGDALLRELAMALRRLEIFSLAYDMGYDEEDVRPCEYSTDLPPRPKTSLAGLAALAYWCENLQGLTLTMDFDPPTTPPLPEWILQSRARRPLKEFNTADSRIGDAPWLAVWFLAAMFGQLKVVKTLHWHVHDHRHRHPFENPSDPYLEELYEYGVVWQQVNELLPAAKAKFKRGVDRFESFETESGDSESDE